MEPQSLRRELNAAFARPDDVQLLGKLHGMLRQSKGLLRDPLRIAGRNADQRKALEEAKTKPADPVHLPGRAPERIPEPQRKMLIDAALVLSDRLALSETRCWDLVKLAINQQRRDSEQSDVLLAEQIFFKEREDLLHCLSDLVKGRSAPYPSLRDLLASFTNELLKDGLAKELLKYLANQPGGLPQAIASIPPTAESPESLRAAYWTEMKSIAECLFYIYYQTTITHDEADRVLQLMKEFSKAVKFQGGEEQPATPAARPGTLSNQLSVVVVKPVVYQPLPQSLGEYHVAYILLLTVISFFDASTTLVDPRRNVTTENKLLTQEARDFIAKVTRECQEGNVTELGPFYGATAFALGRFFLQRAVAQGDPDEGRTESLFRAALNQDAFSVLRDIVLSRPFVSDLDANKDVYLSVLDELMNVYLMNNAMHIRHMKNAEEEAHRALQQAQNYGPPPPAPTQHYVNMLKLLAAVYRNRGELQEKFWTPEENEGAYRFLKFVAGENLAEWFFVPFIDLVASLASSPQSAPHAYVLLKDYGKYANWDHFFRVIEQYYLDYQESTTDMVASEGYGRKDMREADVLGLQAILRLVQEIARHSPSNALLMTENSSWHVLESLFALLACPVSAALKGELLNTVTAFAAPGNKDVLMKIWMLLESTQILMTVPATQPGAPPRDIAFELQEVERAAGTYTATVAFLKLLAELLVTATPSMLARLGSTYRQGGFTPYLTFVRDVVFVQHDIQPYVHKGEKWKVAAAALLIMYRVIKDYDPRDEAPQAAPSIAPAAPAQPMGGFLLNQPSPAPPAPPPPSPAADLYRYLVSSSERNKLLSILAAGVDVLAEKRFGAGETTEAETTVLLALQIVDCILTKEAAGNVMGLQHSMDRLLVSKRLVVPISRYLKYSRNPEIARLAVRTLDALAMKKQPLVSIFQEAREDDIIIESLCHRLEEDEAVDRDDSEEGSSSSGASVRSAILVLIVRPLRDASADAAKFSHMLLGFDVSDHPRSLSNARSLPGGVNATSHCFGVILALLDSPSFAAVHPHQARLVMEILYRLVSSRFTAERTLQFVRNRPAIHKDFFSDLIQQQISSALPKDPTLLLSALWQRTYLLKSLAIDLRKCERDGQRTRENQLLAMLLLVQSPLEGQNEMDEFVTSSTSAMQGDLAQPRIKMLELLDFIGFYNEEPRPPQPPRFIRLDPASYTRPLPAHRELQLIDLTAMHRDMVLLLQRAENENIYSMQQLQQMQQEIKDTLTHALQRNKWRALHHAKMQLFSSWNQLLTVCLSVCYAQLRTLEKREEIVYTLIDSLADKLKLRETAPDREAASIANGISSALLMLITRLRELGDVNGMRPVARLHTILEALLHPLLAPDSSSLLRMNLYASLTNYLHFCQQSILNVIAPTSQVAGFDDAQNAFRTFLQTDEVTALQKQLEQGNQQRLGAIGTENLSTGERLIDQMCHDACNSTPACSAAAFAALDTLLFYDLYHKWLEQLKRKNYLLFFIDQVTGPLPADPHARARSMMVSESILSLFKRIASTERGARHLISMGLVTRLAEADFLSSPTLSSAIVAPPPGEDQLMSDEAATEKLPQQALTLQVIQILTSILLTLRPNNEDAAQQVLDFIKRHSHLFSAVLKDRRTKDLTALRSLQLVTGLFYQLAPYETLFQQRLELKAAKFEYLLMNLVVSFFSNDETAAVGPGRFSVLSSAEDDDFDAHSEASLVRHQSTLICRHLVGYLRIKARRPGRGLSPVLFAPQLITAAESLALSASSSFSSRMVSTPNASFASISSASARSGPVGRGKLPSLGVLVEHLQNCLDRLSRNVDHYTSIQRDLTHTHDLPVQKLNKLAEKPLTSVTMTLPLARDGSNRVLLAQLQLQDELATRLRESSTLLYIIENLLHLIWIHLSYFLSPEAAVATTSAVPDITTWSGRQRGATTSSLLSVQKQEELRRDANLLLNPILTQLAKLERPHGSEFVALLIRQLRALCVSQN